MGRLLAPEAHGVAGYAAQDQCVYQRSSGCPACGTGGSCCRDNSVVFQNVPEPNSQNAQGCRVLLEEACFQPRSHLPHGAQGPISCFHVTIFLSCRVSGTLLVCGNGERRRLRLQGLEEPKPSFFSSIGHGGWGWGGDQSLTI